MIVHASLEKYFDQIGWSVGYCPNCKCTEAIRIGDIVETFKLMLVPLDRARDPVSLCDYCRQAAKPDPDAMRVSIKSWNYGDGITALFAMCIPGSEPDEPRFRSDEEVDAMLRAVTKSTSISRLNLQIDMSWRPVLVGILFGAILFPVLAMLLEVAADKVDCFLAAGLGALVGGIAGMYFGALGATYKAAERRVNAQYHKYEIDDEILTRVSNGFPPRIRRAARLAVAGRVASVD